MTNKRTRRYYLGNPISKESLRTPEENARDSLLKVHTRAGAPSAWDWRNVGGLNYDSGVDNQEGCGSCTAFGSIATLEDQKRIFDNNPNLNIKLSTADIFEGQNCTLGMNLEQANNILAEKGVCTYACYPYYGYPNPANKLPCADSLPRLKIQSATRITSDLQAKEWLSTHGPIQAQFLVYSDFYYDYPAGYPNGVFVHNPNDTLVIGGHCVCLIGYDDVLGCWIFRNSWGNLWGLSGYFKMAYGNCGVFRDFACYGYTLAPNIYTGRLTTFAKNQAMDAIFGSGTPSSIFLGLAQSIDGNVVTGEPEIGVNGYARKEIVNNATNFPAASGGGKSCSLNLSMSKSTGPWASGADLPIVVLFDAATDGNAIAFGTLDWPQVVAGARVIVQFFSTDLMGSGYVPADDLSITLN